MQKEGGNLFGDTFNFGSNTNNPTQNNSISSSFNIPGNTQGFPFGNNNTPIGNNSTPPINGKHINKLIHLEITHNLGLEEHSLIAK